MSTFGQELQNALVEGDGLNDFLYRFLECTAAALDCERVVLYDYDERADRFELLYFRGYPPQARAELHRHLATIEPRRALSEREPYDLPGQPPARVIPLYFQSTLEALLYLESPGAGDDASHRLLSRFLGLFLSSTRLPINRSDDSLASGALECAREIQLSYLPTECPVSDRYEIHGYNQSSALVGGDYFDYFCTRADSLQLVLADACGHGMPAAGTICTFRQMLYDNARTMADQLGSLFGRINHMLYSNADQLRYLTGLYLDYTPETRVLRYVNAGHYEPQIIRPDGQRVALGGGGLPLGMFDHARYEPVEYRIEPGDLLLLFTDGIIDLQNQAEDFFGVERLLEATTRHRNLPLGHAVQEILQRANTFSASTDPGDDLTLFLVRFH